LYLTLGNTFDDASTALRAAVADLTDAPTPQQMGSLLSRVRDFFQTLRNYPDSIARIAVRIPESRTVFGTRLINMRAHFATAEEHLARVAGRYAATRAEAEVPGLLHLDNAHTHLRLSHELLTSHLGADNDPRSPYLHLLTNLEARNYVFYRVTELVSHTGELAWRMAKCSDTMETTADLSLAQRALHQAVTAGRESTASTLWEFGELPLMTTADSTNPYAKPTGPATLDDIAHHCDRLILDVFQAARGTGRPLSGSDVKDIARSFALGYLLTGRTLIHLSADQPAPVRDQVRKAADRLRNGAHQWQHLAQRLYRVVDLADPREHPALPRYSHEDVRAGRANPMPRTTPHPAALTAQDVTLRIGHLLFGEQWRPTMRAPQPRAAADITAETGGLRQVVGGLHRLLGAARYLADAGPHLLARREHSLVTDCPERRPHGLANRLRWYPLPARRIDELLDTFQTVTGAAGRAADALAAAAPSVGTDIPRARLDAAVRATVPLGPLERSLPQVPGVNAPPSRASSRSREPQYRLPSTRRDREELLQAAFVRSRPLAVRRQPPSTRAPGM
jgi:hypothetical protein